MVVVVVTAGAGAGAAAGGGEAAATYWGAEAAPTGTQLPPDRAKPAGQAPEASSRRLRMSSSAWSVEASVAVIDGGPINPPSATSVGAPPQAAIAATLVIAVAAVKVIALVEKERK